jgi:hypothetical protein
MNLPDSHSVSDRECRQHVVYLLFIKNNEILQNESHFVLIRFQIDCDFICLYTHQTSYSLILNFTERLRRNIINTHVRTTTTARSSGKAHS